MTALRTILEELDEKLTAINNAVVNNAEDGDWITINGAHILIKDGESVGESFARTTGKSLGGGHSDAKIQRPNKDSKFYVAHGASGEAIGMNANEAYKNYTTKLPGKNVKASPIKATPSTVDEPVWVSRDTNLGKIRGEASGASIATKAALKNPDFAKNALAKAQADKDFFKSLGVGK